MRYRLLVAMLVMISAGVPSSTRGSTGLRQQTLSLTTSIISLQYRHWHDDKDVLDIRLRLRFINVGPLPLILNMRDAFVLRSMVAENDEAAAGGNFYSGSELACRLMGDVAEQNRRELDKARPGPLFVILAPGEIYETEDSVSVGVVRGDAPRESDAANVGEHVLVVQAVTWDAGEQNLAERLRRRWQRFGRLWTERVMSQPMPFTVERDRSYGG